jgi:transcriptional regulator with XRE-family HTH domain
VTAAAGAQAEVGALLRGWRERRRRTQLDLALDAGVSARHISFVETGRSKPGRDMLLRVADKLEIPFRERNELLLAAGHAPAFSVLPFDDAALAPVREALERILSVHEPYPAMVFDRSWNLVAANASATALTAAVDVEPSLLEEPVNLMRLGFHPRGLGSLVVNYADWRAHFLERLVRQIAATGDAELQALYDEVAGYPVPEGEGAASSEPHELLGPARIRLPDGGEWSFFGMFAGFDTPFEVTTSELALELLFPADRTTAEAFTKGAPT